MWGIQLVPQLVLKQFNTLPTQYRPIEHLHEEVWCQTIFFDKITAFWNEPFFSCLLLNKDFACAYTGNQPVPELLLKVSDTLHLQYRYIEHVHKEVSCQKHFFFFFLFVCLLNNCFSNLAILYGLCILDISFLHWPLLRGVSDKHCLLSFFFIWISSAINSFVKIKPTSPCLVNVRLKCGV